MNLHSPVQQRAVGEGKFSSATNWARDIKQQKYWQQSFFTDLKFKIAQRSCKSPSLLLVIYRSARELTCDFVSKILIFRLALATNYVLPKHWGSGKRRGKIFMGPAGC